MQLLLVLAMAGLLIGCASAPDPAPVVGVKGAVLHMDDRLKQWRGGVAADAFETAVQWWRDAGAEIHTGDWGYPVAFANTSTWGPDMIAFAAPNVGIQVNETLLDLVASQPNGREWLQGVFAHEIGHVLGCGHLEDGASVMHAVVHPSTGLTPQDVDELARVTRKVAS